MGRLSTGQLASRHPGELQAAAKDVYCRPWHSRGLPLVHRTQIRDSRLILPAFSDVQAAARLLAGVAHRTPVLTSASANALTGAQVHFKCENYQRMGAFKFRGAYNAMARLSHDQRAAGVVCFSSGNHAQAIALAGALLGVATVILMPADAPPLKVEATRAYQAERQVAGTELILYDRYRDDREAMMEELARARGLTRIPPYDHAEVIAGAGTVALELLEDAGELDAIYVCLGGGGLTSGCAIAAKGMAHNCRVIGVEPAAGNDGEQSLAQGKLVRIATPNTIADGAQTQSLGALTLAVMLSCGVQARTVTDEQIVSAMRFLAERMKMVVEPTGALSWAAALQDRDQIAGQRIGIVVSGGNVDMRNFSRLMAGT
jgi:threo-3-hydroxy-L-aspartate ammonia-lyase